MEAIVLDAARYSRILTRLVEMHYESPHDHELLDEIVTVTFKVRELTAAIAA